MEPPRLLERPTVWVAFLFVEYLVLIPALLAWVPGTWPRNARIAIWALAVVGVVAANYAILRSLHRR